MRAKIINGTTFPLFSTQHSFQICCPEVTLFSKRFQNFNKTLPLKAYYPTLSNSACLTPK